jgi:ubiquitin-like-conjugating enzyme ATG10
MAPLPHQEHGKIADTLLAVTYDVLLSPSYCVPVLHFSVNDSTGGPIIDLASVYPDVVPSSYRSQVRDMGVIGAISMTVNERHAHCVLIHVNVYKDHPLTGLPTFFVHPCNTAEAMRHVTADDSVPVSDYLFLWMGIISSSVGLTTPSPALAAVWTEE